MTDSSNSVGFTLVELSLVLVIVAVMLSGVLGNVSNQIDNARRSSTIDELKMIKNALLGYSFESVGAYLPCPDCNDSLDCIGGIAKDGIEDRNGNVCIVDNNELGNLPWSTLGLRSGDSWGSRYRYWVDDMYANSSSSVELTTTNGKGVLLERTADGSTTQVFANNIIAVFFSHGKNRYGGSSIDNDIDWQNIPVTNHVDELENTDNDVNFISRLPTNDVTQSVGEYDDTTMWLSGYEFKSILVNVGILP